MNLLKLVYLLLLCTVKTSGDQDEIKLLTNTASTNGASEFSYTQNYISDGSTLGFPSVTSSQFGREVSERGTTGSAQIIKANTTEHESGKEMGNTQRKFITLPKTVVGVALVLLLSTSVLHCVFILHYCMKIWYCCYTQEVEGDVDYSRMSVFGLGDLSNRSSLNKASINLRDKEKKLDVDAKTTYQNYSYRCNTNYNDGFLNLDNAINKGRHSKRISFVSENQQCRRQSPTRSSITPPSEEETIAEVDPERDEKSDEFSVIVPSIQVNPQEGEKAKGISTPISNRESLESPSQIISSKKCTLPFNDQKEERNDSTIVHVHDAHFIDNDEYSLKSIQWQVKGSDNEIATGSTIPINCPINREDSGASLTQRELNSMKKQLEKPLEEPSVEKRKLGLSVVPKLGIRSKCFQEGGKCRVFDGSYRGE